MKQEGKGRGADREGVGWRNRFATGKRQRAEQSNLRTTRRRSPGRNPRGREASAMMLDPRRSQGMQLEVGKHGEDRGEEREM
jgi:hypothetical protein